MKKGCFKRYDFLNVPMSLSYKKEYFYASNMGASLTIFFFLIIIILITYEIVILYQKTSFTLISNQYTDLLQSIDFSETPIFFQITNSNNKIMDLDNKLYELIAYNMEAYVEQYENGTSRRRVRNTVVELEKCNKNNLNNSEFSGLNLSSYICIKPGQNMTAFGLLGDKNNPYKGLRIYINKCSHQDCYDDDEIENQFHNAKFYIYYLSLGSNMFYLNNKDIKYQLLTKFCSLSTNLLKKIVFTFDIGRFHLYNNIFFHNNISFNYLLGNDYSLDFDIDPTSTLKSDEYTIAYISFHYGGNVIETRKEVQTLFEALSIIGNIFNIILTIFKVINSYYSNKILFADIFSNIFLRNEKLDFHTKNNFQLNNSLNSNKKNNQNEKINIDDSAQIYFNNNSIRINKNNQIKQISNKVILTNKKKSTAKRQSKLLFDNKGDISTAKLIYYYILPFWVLKRNKNFNYMCSIKDIICGYFSVEKINELIRFKENLEDKNLKSKMKTIEVMKNNNCNDKNSLDNNKNEKTLN